ncbi:MAG TPA: glycosyl hydrolase, partial [Thermoanaerobaculia bacterium]|nr:glycosyl hydrolase [Thermoanaerobaculia bacterium]
TIVADPRDPDVVYGGSYDGLLVRRNHRTGEVRQVDVWPDIPMGWGAADLRYRFQWNYPLFFSPHDPAVLYAGANVLFETRDEGTTWRAISPDLTRNDKSKQASSGGPITQDNTSIEYYGTIFCAAESPREKGVLWTGSDDGLIHLSRDGGASWKDVTPKGLPEWALINSLEPSPFEAGGLYVAATRYKSDDFHPYLFATHDWGATWTRIDQGIDAEHFTRVIRADPEKKGLLFAGTERGVYASFNDGASWQRFNLNLPIVPVTDLAIRDGILIAATQGRAFWALDDLSLLRQGLGKPAKTASAPGRHLYSPGSVLRLPGGGRRGDDAGPNLGAGTDPTVGAIVYYRLDKAPEKPIEVAFLGADGKVLRRFAGEAVKKKEEKDSKDGKDSKDSKDEKADKEKKDAKAKKDKKEQKAPSEVGLNRFVWDLRLEPAVDFPGMILWNGNPPGPRVAPGRYQVRLSVDGAVETANFEVLPDPRSSASAADLQAQFDFLLSVRDKLSEAHRAIGFIRDTRGSIDALAARLEGDDKKAIREAAEALKKELSGVEEALYQTKMESRQDPLNFPIRLNDKLAGVAGAAGTGDFPPTASAIAVRDELVAAIDVQLAKLREIVAERLPAFESQARAAGITLLPTKIPEPESQESPAAP